MPHLVHMSTLDLTVNMADDMSQPNLVWFMGYAHVLRSVMMCYFPSPLKCLFNSQDRNAYALETISSHLPTHPQGKRSGFVHH